MAGEKKGDAFEALIFIALSELGYRLGEDLHWGEKPSGFSFDSDFILGETKNPTHWIFVTTTISAKNSNMKFWRNLGELFEVKREYLPPPKAINFVMESNQDAVLIESMKSLCDGDIHVSLNDYGTCLIDFINSEIEKFPTSKTDIVDYISYFISKNSRLRLCFNEFKSHIFAELNNKKNNFDSLWKLLRNSRTGSTSIVSFNTYFRRGIAKLIIFDACERHIIYKHKSSKKELYSLPEFVFQLGFIRKSIGIARIVDQDILSVLNYFSNNISSVEQVVSRCYSTRQSHWDKWIPMLRNSPVHSNHEYFLNNIGDLTNPSRLLVHLNKCDVNGVKWLFWHIIEVLKVASGKKQGYGFAVLAQDVGYSKGISQGYKYLADWANGALKSKLPSQLLLDVSRALSKRIDGLKKSDLISIGKNIESEFIDNLLEQKFVTYPYFEPIPILIEDYLSQEGIAFERSVKHPSFIGEYLGKPKNITTPIIKSNKTLIYWKSAYDQGRHHKTKELCGRSTAIKYEFFNGEVRNRSNIEKLILVIDGTFTAEQLDSIKRSGWNDIVYPHEIKKLKNIII